MMKIMVNSAMIDYYLIGRFPPAETVKFMIISTSWLGWFMVFNAIFNNISVISWWSVLLVEETGVPKENH